MWCSVTVSFNSLVLYRAIAQLSAICPLVYDVTILLPVFAVRFV